MSFRILWDKKASDDLEKLEIEVVRRIILKVKSLAEDPFSANIKRLAGRREYRLRVGDYRVIFEIGNEEILVLKVGHRKNVYNY
jgi:mRNA interferase RelE/StbE